MVGRACAAVLVAGLMALGGCGDDSTDEPEAGTSPTTSPTDESRSGDSTLTGRLMFSRFDESTHTFISTHVSRPDGSEETELELPGPEGGGRWSHSGSHIAVMTVLPDERIGTAIITAEGEVERVLEIPDKSLNLVCIVWSPDDSRLACDGWDDADPSSVGIYTVRAADGGGLKRLTASPRGLRDESGDYSPDGRSLVFKRSVDEDDGPLMVVPVAGGKAQRLSDEPYEDSGRYSPDGSKILTATGGIIYVLSTKGEVIETITDEPLFLFGPVWSPDGSHIAYSGASGGYFSDIYTALPDGSDVRQVTSTPDNEIVVEWGAEPN